MYNYIIGLGSRHCLYKPSPEVLEGCGEGVGFVIVVSVVVVNFYPWLWQLRVYDFFTKLILQAVGFSPPIWLSIFDIKRMFTRFGNVKINDIGSIMMNLQVKFPHLSLPWRSSFTTQESTLYKKLTKLIILNPLVWTAHSISGRFTTFDRKKYLWALYNIPESKINVWSRRFCKTRWRNTVIWNKVSEFQERSD